MRKHPARQSSLVRGHIICGLLTAIAIGGAATASAIASELRRTAIVKAAEAVRSSIVNIHGQKTVGANDAGPSFEAPRRVNGMGTGVVIDERGYIVTNYHVVEGVRKIEVTLADEKTYVAQLIAHDLTTDLAVIKITVPEKLPVIAVGTSSDLMPGEPVIAIGNAYGYQHTVTRGIVSALHRTVQVSDTQDYEDLIQTDASINPGNSGGPLLNIDGEMIGINVAVRAGAQGIGFAIPVDKALAVTTRLLSKHRATNNWHGVTAKDVSGTSRGFVVAAVDAESPAAEGGLLSGDVITAVESQPVARPLDFERALLDRKAGEMVAVTVQRDQQPVTINFKLASSKKPSQNTDDSAWEMLGMKLSPMSSQQFTQYATRYRGGLTVTAVRPESPAAKQGIRKGDVLVGMHIWETVSLENVAYVLNRPDFNQIDPLKFYILRGSETLYGHLRVSLNK